jgi:hypothetical protein
MISKFGVVPQERGDGLAIVRLDRFDEIRTDSVVHGDLASQWVMSEKVINFGDRHPAAGYQPA